MKPIYLLFAITLISASCNKNNTTSKTNTSPATTASGWTEVGALNEGVYIRSIAIDASNNIYVTNGTRHVSKWDGTKWSPLGKEGIDEIKIVAADTKGNIYTDYAFSNTRTGYLSRWNGTDWEPVGIRDSNMATNGVQNIMTIDAAGNIYLAVVKVLSASPTNQINSIAKWDGNKWTDIGNPPNDAQYPTPNQFTTDSHNNLYATGFSNQGRSYIAKWDGNLWSEFGSGSPVTAVNITFDKKDNAYAACIDVSGNKVTKSYVCKWDGSKWQELGTLNAAGEITTLTTDAAGNVYVAGFFKNANGRCYVAKWNGSEWSDLGNLDANESIFNIITDAAGNVYAGGSFRNSNNKAYVAKYSH